MAGDALTNLVRPVQPFPDRSKELERLTGVKARFVDPEKTKTLVSTLAPLVSPKWGDSNYANPVFGTVGIKGYQGGATPEERHIEFHELGHLNPRNKGLHSYFGVAGRALEGISDATGNLPPLDLAAGLALQHADAPEEDRAERFAAKYAERGNFKAPVIDAQGRSEYGDDLREQGDRLADSAIERMVNPFGLRTKVESFINAQRAKPLQEELTRSLPSYREMLRETDSPTTPELMRESERLSNLERRIRDLGVQPQF